MNNNTSVKISDEIALFLKEKGIRHVFGIVGAGNAHIFDSIGKLGYTEIISVHHEQAAVMSAAVYYRTCNKVSAAIVTTGGGSSNAVTGVVSAWMDSLPVLIISGNEKSVHTTEQNTLRVWGVQGYDSVAMVNKVTKYSSRVLDAKNATYEIEKAYDICSSDRPGPCWIDVPMDIQATKIEANKIRHFEKEVDNPRPASVISAENLAGSIQKTFEMIENAQRPLLWLGHGIRLSGATDKLEALLESTQIPALLTWQAMDMLPSDHELVFGRAGVYGQRHSNFIVQNCDLLICIGTRMAYPQIGYNVNELAREAKIITLDIDEQELNKFSDRIDLPICANAKDYVGQLIEVASKTKLPSFKPWLDICNKYKDKYPVIGKEHDDTQEFINSYRFIDKLSEDLEGGWNIVTDMGTALLSGHQALNLKDKQRLITSTGLGEMGFGLPAAIGASFASDKGKVLCLNCDGGIMMNLQELQTLDHHQLPIKIIIFNNDGYLMIKHTQNNLFDKRYVCTNRSTGVSCPDFSKVAEAFNLEYYSIKTWEDYNNNLSTFLESDKAAICDVYMEPEQKFYPKVDTYIDKNGNMVSPPLEDMSPLISRQQLKEDMVIKVHESCMGADE